MENQETLPFDEAKLAELLKASQADTVKATIAQMKAEFDQQQQNNPGQQQQQQQSTTQDQTGDIWDTLINEKTAGKFQQANLQGQIAHDVASFYTSDFWNETVDTWLTGETDAERKAEKKGIREKVEKLFAKSVRENRPLPRADIAKFVLMEELESNKEKHEDGITKRRTKKTEVELEKAKGAVDIAATSVANFQPDDIYALSIEDMHKKFANLAF